MTADEATRLTELAKRRGFYFPAVEAYGGAAGFYVYGPEGARIKENIEESWREQFVVRHGHMEIKSPTVMPGPVFEASGHLDGFDDFLVECAACGTAHRADHLIEESTEITDAESLSPEEISTRLDEHDIACPACGTSLAGEPVTEFNLMFGTNIGPGSTTPGFLRPETAQGIFVEFPRLKEYARGQLPFGVAQIGPAYRNEISPRRGLVRLREFTQAELEVFIDPTQSEPPLNQVADVTVPLYSAQAQQSDGSIQHVPVQEAIDEGIVGDPWIGYYLGLAREWYADIGVDMDRFRYRQHLAGERAHYAADCWDAESEVGGNWIELTGFADRADYDLAKHTEHSAEEFTLFQPYDDPQTVERPSVSPDMSYLGPEYGEAAADIASALDALAEKEPDDFADDSVTVEVDGETYDIPRDRTGFTIEEATVTGEHMTPHVIEPSFGIDRLVYTVLAHTMTEDRVDDEPRTVMRLPPDVAPTTLGVFPLMAQDGLDDRARTLAENLRADGISVTYDDSGSIGRRYRREDEVGTPYCVTVDYETLEDDTVTIRDRDTARQRRISVDDVHPLLAALTRGERDFDSIGTAVSNTP